MDWIETREGRRLVNSEARKADWKRWGPYLSERAWGTVREDYSATGEAWEYFPHDHARSRAYRWNEDGLGGFCNRFQNICLGVGLWNERDPILKERLFGLTGPQGNHGEDVKELYYYLDSTPTHSYLRMVYIYPQAAFPYADLVETNRERGLQETEYELTDALRDELAEGRYFEVTIEYAKAAQEEVLGRVTILNRGPDPAPLHVLPQVWFRNTWSWGYGRPRPELKALKDGSVYTDHRHLGERWWRVQGRDHPLLFTENETNHQRLFGTPNPGPYVKDAFHQYLIHGREDRVNPERRGTKAAAHLHRTLDPGEEWIVRLHFADREVAQPWSDFGEVFQSRLQEADQFYQAVQRPSLSEDQRLVQRQAFAGLMWTKQFYHYSVKLWLEGDPAGPPPPPERREGRNADWTHLYNLDVLSMPDAWEYPWYAAWDLAFHTLPIAMIDPEWAKRQIILLLREWYMHPNGQLPAYEWALGDVNPPVHAWAAFQVYRITREMTGEADTLFLERVFQKLLLNFTWWVNRVDQDGNNIFQGGFLGLDNIGVFDRSAPLPTGGHLEQADGTAWMGMFSLNMLAIALELARTQPAYEDMATKFFEHFIYIADAINHQYGEGGLWDEEDGFFYDVIHCPDGSHIPLEIRSFVGLIPLFAVEILDEELLDQLPRFRRRMDWFLENRPWLVENVASLTKEGEGGSRLLSLVNQDQLTRVLKIMLDEDRFLSAFGLRSLSKEHQEQPFHFQLEGEDYSVAYQPGESTTGLFGGNSNWRGPVWFPINYLMVESLWTYHRYYGGRIKVEMPHGSGRAVSLDQVAVRLSRRLIKLFLKGEGRGRPVHGDEELYHEDPGFRDRILFYEYFHGETGAGLGASHQTGWTALVAELIDRCGGETPGKEIGRDEA